MSYIEGFSISNTTTTQEFRLGNIGRDFNGDEYMYVQADATGWAFGDVVIISTANVGAKITTALAAPGTGTGNRVGISNMAFAASEYGWIKVYGAVTRCNVASACVANTRLNTTATAGRIDDDATVGARVIDGLITTSAESGNNATAFLQRPRVGATL